jgi:hypothetical protein
MNYAIPGTKMLNIVPGGSSLSDQLIFQCRDFLSKESYLPLARFESFFE